MEDQLAWLDYDQCDQSTAATPPPMTPSLFRQLHHHHAKLAPKLYEFWLSGKHTSFINSCLPLLISSVVEERQNHHLEVLVVALYNEQIESPKVVAFPINEYFPSCYDKTPPIRLSLRHSRLANETPLEKLANNREGAVVAMVARFNQALDIEPWCRVEGSRMLLASLEREIVRQWPKYLEALVQLMLCVKNENGQVAAKMMDKITQLSNEELHMGVMLQSRALQNTLDRDQAKMGDFTGSPELPERRSTLAVKSGDINYSSELSSNDENYLTQMREIKVQTSMKAKKPTGQSQAPKPSVQ